MYFNQPANGLSVFPVCITRRAQAPCEKYSLLLKTRSIVLQNALSLTHFHAIGKLTFRLVEIEPNSVIETCWFQALLEQRLIKQTNQP